MTVDLEVDPRNDALDPVVALAALVVPEAPVVTGQGGEGCVVERPVEERIRREHDRLQAAAEAIFDPENNITGLVVPTDSKLVSTQRVFEHLAIANGCRLIDGTGKITLLHPACLDSDSHFPGPETGHRSLHRFCDSLTRR